MKLIAFRMTPVFWHRRMSKTLLVMKLTVALILAACLQVSAKGYSQRITLTLKNASIETAFKEIQKQSGYNFIYAMVQVNKAKNVTLVVHDATLEEVLQMCFKDQPLTYTFYEDNIVVKLKPDEPKKENPLPPPPFPIRGKVVDENGQPVIGATITVKGTTRGTATDGNGNFSIEANAGEVLVITSVSHTSQEVTIRNGDQVSVSLKTSSQAITEVVVTALGIKRERKALGYSVSEIKGSELTQAREINVGNSLIGKVAGVSVSPVSGGPGSSVNIIIRGVSSLTGDNQPLYVVNGVPISNNIRGNGGNQFANSPDMGDGIQNINPDDIETISVLKGAAASALYGSRAKAGVILITTKTGSGKGTIELNSNFVADQIVDPTDWQYVYGQGANNVKPTSGTAAFQSGNTSWGAKLDGSSVLQFDSVARPYVAHKDNIRNFYRTGSSLTNTLSFGKGFEGGGGIRLSGSYLKNESVLPNSGLKRYSFNLSSVFNVTKQLTVDIKSSFISDKADNRPILADGAGNSNFQVMFLPTSLDVNDLKPGTNADGTEKQFTNNTFATNPWFAAYKFINGTRRNRFINTVSLKYTFNNGLYAQARAGRDFYNDRLTGVVPTGTAYYSQAGQHIVEQTNNVSEINLDFLIGKSFKVNSDLTITANAGGNLMKAKSETSTISGLNFAVPYVYTILNAKTKTVGYNDLRQEIQSLYATAEFAYRGLVYLNATGREDWFSTLAPSKDLSIFYPSVSASVIFSELWKPSWLTFGKIRAGWANVGSALPPYQTLLSYGLFGQQLNGLPLGNISNASIPNSELIPGNASEIEIGAEMRLFKNRMNIDFAWYNKKSKDEIVPAPASSTSGYTGVVLNLGEVTNTGVELLIGGSIIKSKNFNWTSSVNGSLNKNTIDKLAEGQSQLPVATSRTGTGFTRNIVGLAANQVMAFDYKYDANKQLVLGPTGIPAQGDLIPLGSAYHKWTGGWNNEFSYKRLSLSFLIDGKFGGKVFSATENLGYTFGLHKATLVNREGTFGTGLQAQAYYAGLASNVSRLFVYDASFVKFRQLMISYSIDSKFLNNFIQGATISLVGRNLFTLMKHTDNFDPEASYSGVTQGLELGGVPPIRSFGANLNLKF